MKVDEMQVPVKRIFKNFDLPLIELPPESKVEFTDFGSAAVLEDALLVNDMHVMTCRMISAGSSLFYGTINHHIPVTNSIMGSVGKIRSL
ncbi:hypothetical protein [Methanomethylovorans sp.]|uniref:hypothetical protein n=1 Tax=Methanomethylovorans sp. TaxID=2758717 RepID=UPI00351C2005